MRSEQGTRRVFASLRVHGDSLDPEQVTRALCVFPTIAYAKGARYSGGKRTGELVGRTGVWLLSTETIVASDIPSDHLQFLIGLLVPSAKVLAPLTRLRALLAKHKDCRADVACFWHGTHGERRPAIPREIGAFLKMIPAELELDFANDSQATEATPA
jgi:hypothetical protein